MGSDWAPDVEGITTLTDFVDFLDELRRQAELGRIENHRLEVFLEALWGWTDDMSGRTSGAESRLPHHPSWAVVAQMLLAATVYD